MVSTDKDRTQIWLLLSGCSSQIDREISRRLRDQFGHSLARFQVLAQLAQSKTGMALGAVADELIVSQSNVTTLTNQLIKAGYIRRVTSPADGRVQLVLLTRAGRAAFRRMLSEQARLLSELFAHIPANNAANLVRELARLKQSVSGAIANNDRRLIRKKRLKRSTTLS